MNSLEMEHGRKIHYKVGSRQSQLALIQTKWIIQTLENLHPETTYEIVSMKTIGDKILDVALSKIGDKGLFTQELEIALEKGEIDFVVHSLKDLPTQLPPGLTVAAITKREDPRDAVLFKSSVRSNFKKLQDLPPGSVVGTSALRRIAQLRNHFPQLSFMDIRGNLNTRLRKLDDVEGPYSALILAVAGVTRMGWEDRIDQILDWEECMHAVGQGALGVECKNDNIPVLQLLEPLNDPGTYFRCLAERAFLRILEGGCSVPVAVFSEFHIDQSKVSLSLRGSVWSLDGKQSVSELLEKDMNEENSEDANEELCLTSVHPRSFQGCEDNSYKTASSLGSSLGKSLLRSGAKPILDEVKSQSSKT